MTYFLHPFTFFFFKPCWVLVAVHRLSCSMPFWILVSQPGIKPKFPALWGGFFTTGPQGKSHTFTFDMCFYIQRGFVQVACCLFFFPLTHSEHQKSHTGEKCCGCTECGKAFTHTAHLRIYQRHHTVMTCCECSECEKSVGSHTSFCIREFTQGRKLFSLLVWLDNSHISVMF